MIITRIGVVGCGLMGAGITQVLAAAGYPTHVCEAAAAPLQRGLDRIRDGYARAVKKGTLAQVDADAAFARITPSLDRRDLADCDLVIEAIAEDLTLKTTLFAELDAICGPQAILASNTSSIPIHQLAQATTRPDRVAGFHFFNPVPVMQLIELVSTPFTSSDTQQALHAVGTQLAKTVVDVQDVSGFIVNRLLIPYLFDAVRLLEQGVASRDAIDTAVAIGDVLAREFNDAHLAPPQRLREMVAQGLLGRKSGQGFYPTTM